MIDLHAMQENTASITPKPGQMALAARLGRLWFQWRSLSPLPLFALMILLRPDFVLHGAGLVAVVTLLLGAEALRVWAVGYAGSATRTRGDSVPQLVHAGPYRFVRNPLYVANTALYTLCGVLFGFMYLSVGIFVYSVLEYSFIVAFEEEILSRTFGDSYRRFRQQVPRWLVSPFPRCPSSGHRFDLKRGLVSEKSTLIAIAVMGLVYVLKLKL